MTAVSIEQVIVGESAPVVALRHRIVQCAALRLSVLIEGPSGSGKELVARALHDLSGRRGSFVATNVCALGETLFENELFGHRRGAFSGARSYHRGLCAEADGGTLFLDEIGGLQRPLQAKLLRVIETGTYRPLGGGRDERSDFRVVCATNEGLAMLAATDRFRPDLMHRLAAIVLRTPALDARRSDIPLLVVAHTRALGASTDRFTEAALDELTGMTWPGNVRQLHHFTELLLSFHAGTVTRADVRELARAQPIQGVVRPASRPDAGALLSLMEAHDWKARAVASTLGVHVATVYRRLQRLQLSPRD